MWTTKNRPRYDRDKLRYPSDLTDEEWSLVKPLIPPAKRGGRKREVVVREVVNGVMYVLSTGCQWRYIPRICHQGVPCMTTSPAGMTTGRSRGSIMRCMCNAARRLAGRPARPPA
jgi:hypothetical protein